MDKNKNLIPGGHKFTAEERSRGGKAGAKVRKERTELRKCLQVYLESEDLKIKDANGNPMTGAEALAATIFKAALKGDIRAFEVVRDTAGQKPVDKVVTATVDPSVIDEVERMVSGDDGEK